MDLYHYKRPYQQYDGYHSRLYTVPTYSTQLNDDSIVILYRIIFYAVRFAFYHIFCFVSEYRCKIRITVDA